MQNERSILVVDDNVQLLKLLQLSFERQGYTVLTGTSGDEALEALRTCDVPSVLLTDAVMPGRNQGKDVATAFKRLRLTHPVIMMSAYVDLDDFSDEEQAAIDYFVPKPFNLPALSKVVSEALALFFAQSNQKEMLDAQ